MTRVGKHSAPGGRRAGPRVPSRRHLPWAAIALTTAAVVAWIVLVWFAIQFGPEARAGQPSAWLLMAVAALGAMACLFLALVQGMKVHEHLRTTPRVRAAPRPVGGRRAKR